MRWAGVAVAALLVFAICGGRVLEERFVFESLIESHLSDEPATRVSYVAGDGQPLFGLALDPDSADAPQSAAGVILVFHGVGAAAGSHVEWGRQVARRTGWPVFLAEYRGYGGLDGEPSYDGVRRDAWAAFAAASHRYGLESSQVVLYGREFGAGVAMQLAAERPVRAVLLEAPMTSLRALQRRQLRPPVAWVLPLVSRNTFAPVRHARVVTAPIWIVAGESDRITPPAMARAVRSAARVKGEVLIVPGATHDDIAERGGPGYWAWMTRALGVEAIPDGS